jgi:IS66 C-terminal element
LPLPEPVLFACSLANELEQAWSKLAPPHGQQQQRKCAESCGHRKKIVAFHSADDHVEAGANLYSLIASRKLHGIDPERYLAEVIRVMPYWPRARYLELAPAYWTQTRARLDPVELEAELGFVTVPPVLVDTAQHGSAVVAELKSRVP